MRRLLVHCPTEHDATSYYRGLGPFSDLTREMADLSVMKINDFNWTNMHFADAIVLQRPFLPDHVKIAEMTKQSRIPLWVDFDDDLFSVPPHNETHCIYGMKSTQDQVAKVTIMADVVTVTNEHLRERLLPLNKNVIVIPNAFEDRRFDGRAPRREQRDKIVFWRGGRTHEADLMQVCPQLVELSHDPELKDWFFQFMGYNPWWATNQMRSDHTICSAPIDVVSYFGFIETLQPPIWIVPLINDTFNRSKSNVSWIEAAYAGAVVIAPSYLPEFHRPGVILYETSEQFGPTLRDAMTGKYDLLALSEKGWEAVKSNLFLTKVNKMRAKVLNDLLSSPRGY